MATHFEVAIASDDAAYAGQAAAAVFREIDRLERELSRFVESSDITRVNRLAEGETTVVGEDAFECLLIATDAFLATRGAFDIAYASDIPAAARHSSGSSKATGERALPFQLDEPTQSVTSRTPRLRLDLGAVGKGYALDVGAGVLGEWQLACACLVAGGSSVVTLDAPPQLRGWEVGVGDPPRIQRISLHNVAISASGAAVQGRHIIDPRTGQPAPRDTRTWALASSGALSDALSTAFFVMSDAEIDAFCREHPQVSAAVTLPDGSLRASGALAGLLSSGIS